MGGISSTGLISGIDTQGLINSLIQVAARPRTLATQRLVQLQTQQAAYLDINSRLSALRTASSAFRTQSLFDAKRATSGDTDVLTATATNQAQPGTYSLLVDRLVTNQQLLTRGFQDRDTSAFGATSFTFEPEAAKITRDTELADLNNGQGIKRGKIQISDGTDTMTIDLSKAATVSEVLDAINESGLDVNARVSGGRFIIDRATSVTNIGSGTTAESLGILTTGTDANATVTGSGVTGATVYALGENTSLAALNDGNGVDISGTIGTNRFDFIIEVNDGSGAQSVFVNVGPKFNADGEETEARAGTIGDVVERINEALAAANGGSGFGVEASINSATNGISLEITDPALSISVKERNAGANNEGTTARDLGLAGLTGSGLGTANGAAIFAGLNTVLLKNLGGGNNGTGIPGDGRLNITLRDGTTVNLNLPSTSTVSSLMDTINQLGAFNSNKFSVSLNDAGTGLIFNDKTGGSQNLIITGTNGDDTAAALGLSTGAAGIAENSVGGASLQMRYISEGTLLDDLNGGNGIGVGEFRVTGKNGESATVKIDENDVSLRDIIRKINNTNVGVTARINDNGDGLVVEGTGDGATAIEIRDSSGTVASRLGIAGEAEDNATNNFIDGSLEKTIEFDPTDTLDDAVTKINAAGAGVRVSVINDGSASAPYRLSIVANNSGSAGRFILDTNGFDLDPETLSAGTDARVFFGSSDPAKAVLISSTTNALDDVIQGVNIDLLATSETPVNVTIANDTSRVESQVDQLVSAYNTVLDRIKNQTRFVEDTGERGALLGDTTIIGLQAGLFSTANGTNFGFNDQFSRLAEVGVTIGTGGKLEFDKDRFREALADDPEAVEELFTRRTIDPDSDTTDFGNGITVTDRSARTQYTELGVIPQLEQLADLYIDSIDGVLTRRNRALDNQIQTQQGRIDSLTEGLTRERERLERQFVAMEQALAQLQGQQNALASIGL
jgi:flagellar hook-associated protein 2